MLTLVIGDRSYSTWSLRPWLALEQSGIPFQERRLTFADPAFKSRVGSLSPSGRIPVLIDGDLTIWDSLAIVEYLAERHPDKQLWPADVAARAVARSMCAEMHSGFSVLRSHLTMNFTAQFPAGTGRNVRVDEEIARILAMWSDARARFGSGGPFLFGAFSIADAFFAPVAQRFAGYDVALPAAAQAYVDLLLGLPAMKRWAAAARAEHVFYPPDEPYRTDVSQFPPRLG